MESITPTLIDRLLREDESTALDFKGEQYSFQESSVSKKAEFLKDLLAFANSWRRTTAYILTGVVERKGGSSEVTGISDELDDASLQQFVNSKTQRPLQLSYRSTEHGGRLVGVFEIPVQRRPVYLKKDYGKVEKGIVYVRRGSSTAIVSPDEIAEMGASGLGQPRPTLELMWAEIDKRVVLSSPCEIVSRILAPKLSIGPRTAPTRPRGLTFASLPLNENYEKEIIEFTFLMNYLQPVGFRLANIGDGVARNILFVGCVEKGSAVQVVSWEDRPRRPVRNTWEGLGEDITPLAEQLRKKPEPTVKEFDTEWEISVEFGDIRPGERVWSSVPILVATSRAKVIEVKGQLKGDNLSKPISVALQIVSSVEERIMAISDVEKYLGD